MPPPSRGGRLARAARLTLLTLAAAAGVAVAGVVGLALVLRARDPAPGFAARRGRLARVAAGEARAEGGHLLQAVTLTSTSGLAVELLVKRDTSGRPGPLVVILGGHQTGMQAATLIPDTRGRVVAALAYPYDGPHRIRGLAVLRWAPRIRRALVDTPPAVQLALDWLVAQPWVDARQVEGVGASLGAPFMTVAAATDRRIGRLWLVQGGADSRALLEHNARRYLPAPVRPAGAWLADVLVAGPYLTPERWIGRVAPRPVVLVNSTEDERIPRPLVERLYAHAGAPKAQLWLPGRHVMRRRPEVVRQLVTTVLERMEAEPIVAVPDSSAAPAGPAAARTTARPGA